MRIQLVKVFSAVFRSIAVTSCATISRTPDVIEANANAYIKTASKKGVVILAINWYRRWGCGQFEHAEIMSIGFDRLPLKSFTNDSPSELFIDRPLRLMKSSLFLNYALLLEPGEYALTSFDVLAARTRFDVGHFIGRRNDLVHNGLPLGGSFKIEEGEIVYIGNFFLNCQQNPMIWRYYTEGRDAFLEHMAEVK